MKWMEGERPNIVKNFLDTTDDKVPFLVTQSRKIKDNRPLKEILVDFVPKGLEFIGYKDNLKIDQCDAGYVETFEQIDSENSPEMVDRGRFLRTYLISRP